MSFVLFFFSVFLLSTQCAADKDVEFGPVNRAPEEAIAGFSTKNLEQFQDKAPVLFAQFMASISSQFDKASPYHTDIASAQFYFNDLYATGSYETKKCLTALTTKLDKLMRKEYWSTEKKALLIHAFLQSSFSELLKTLHTKQDKEKAQKLSRHLIVSLTPTLLGMSDKIKRLPWKRIALLSALAGGATYAYKNNLWQHFKNNTANTFKVLGHINNSIAENQRAKDAFEETLERNAQGKIIMQHDHTAGRPKYKVKAEFRPQDGREWVFAPEGFGDRALRLGEELKPLVTRVVDKLSDSANEQQAWFIAHKIPTDKPHDHFKLVETGPGAYEMRYVSTATVPAEQTPQGSEDLKPFMIKNKLWKNRQTGTLHPTFLPPRNLMEHAITTAGGLVNALQDKTIKDFITILGAELTRSRNDALNWLKSQKLVADDATDPTSLLRGVSVHWDKKDNRIYYRKTDPDTGGAEADPIYPPASVIDKLFMGITTITDKGSGSEELIRTIANALANSQRDMRHWLFNEGLSLSPDSPALKPSVGYYSDEDHMEYYLRDKTQGDEFLVDGKKNKVYPPLSGASHLFTTLSKISREGGIPLEQLMTFVKKELEGVKDWGDEALGELKYGAGGSLLSSETTKQGAAKHRARRLEKLIETAESNGVLSSSEKATIRQARQKMAESLKKNSPALLDGPTEAIAAIAYR